MGGTPFAHTIADVLPMCPVQTVTYVPGSDHMAAQGNALGIQPRQQFKPFYE